MRFFFLLYLVTAVLFNAESQNYISTRAILFTVHPTANENLKLHKNKIDSEGVSTFEPGIILSFESTIYKKTYLGISTSIVNDRFSKISTSSEIYIKYTFYKYWKHFFRIGFGPTVYYGNNRSELNDYNNEEDFKIKDNFQYKISWLSGFLEYNYYLSKKTQISLAINNIHPYSIGFTAGIRFELTAGNGKGCDCPSYK